MIQSISQRTNKSLDKLNQSFSII